MILRHLLFEKTLSDDFLLFHVVVNNMEVGFSYAVELVGKIVY